MLIVKPKEEEEGEAESGICFELTVKKCYVKTVVRASSSVVLYLKNQKIV